MILLYFYYTTFLAVWEDLFSVSLANHFNPLPPQGGRHTFRGYLSAGQAISIHFLPKEGDAMTLLRRSAERSFQSTPSPRRETLQSRGTAALVQISIHSLPKEGDIEIRRQIRRLLLFQSTPSPRRETWHTRRRYRRRRKFQSTPSPRRETRQRDVEKKKAYWISIHSLPKEGDA